MNHLLSISSSSSSRMTRKVSLLPRSWLLRRTCQRMFGQSSATTLPQFLSTRKCKDLNTTKDRNSTPLGSNNFPYASFSTAPADTTTSTSSTSTSRRRPFDKVLIANRGEIVQRVIRTCHELDMSTVAVYSSADAQAPFVQEADEAYCLGPAQASQSYLNTDALLHAIASTGAQAVHPGYGFLSENAAFAQRIADATDAVWLGPPAHAIQQMGDKLASKELAVQAGVTTVPGHEQPLESLEQALQLCNDGAVPYPVLLKALAGGGGKGMRVCFNDLELREAWNVSKAEAKQFFGDDRLLLEKFIEQPHHIEFQVMATPTADGTTDVVVFPERECSIQRRNQKIIEESPSVLLTEETRQSMVQQVVRLCQAAGYESAGTMEFLVDSKQNFYFLEMNTRLQVEHPVTEEACGGLERLDLVKAMLWIGAGWGFPDEIEQMREGNMVRPMRHAMEARIYAEDPVRGFLPSTGPLVPYVEPHTSSGLRVDSGVTAGHVVTPHYDPMLSKVISKGTTRLEAIQRLSQSMDEYVIEGVQHNARLVQAVLRNPSFIKGDTPTSFLPTHFPDGFHKVELTETERHEYAAVAALIDAARRSLLQQPVLAGQHNDETSVVVRMGGFFGDAFRVDLDGTSAKVDKLAKDENGAESLISLELNNVSVQLEPDRYVAQVSLGDSVPPRTVQVLGETSTGELKLQMFGCDKSVIIQSRREYELSQHMKEPEMVDTSKLVLSPMPGTLISFAVEAGDNVMEGQELCIVEAMKMQNIIRSPKQGTIAGIKVKTGDSLMADQVIMEFEEEDQAE